ncbi:hypothetical protein HY839_04115 [Candidatus Azambacteria bacterium]|nr:hypothetical protein [Candidatus Azambacteria bacterium]
MSKEKFDFSTSEDQEQFNALPEEAQETLIDKAREEANKEERVRDEGGNDFSIPEHQKYFEKLSEEKKEKRISKAFGEAVFRNLMHDRALEYGLNEEEEELLVARKIYYMPFAEHIRILDCDNIIGKDISNLISIIEKTPSIELFSYGYGQEKGFLRLK